jgi:hypothetical protein
MRQGQPLTADRDLAALAVAVAVAVAVYALLVLVVTVLDGWRVTGSTSAFHMTCTCADGRSAWLRAEPPAWGRLGRGGYEGVQNDSDGNLWIVEDIGGRPKGTHDRQDPQQLRLPLPAQQSRRPAPRQAPGAAGAQQPRTADHAEIPDAAHGADQVELHDYGNELSTRWVQIDDTATDGTAPFNANMNAKRRARHAVQAARERGLPARVGLQAVLLHRDRRHERHEPGERQGLARRRCRGWASIQRPSLSAVSGGSLGR